MSLTRYLLPALVLSVGFGMPGIAAAQQELVSKIDGELPRALHVVARQGVEFIDTFEAPGGLTGYIGHYQGQGLAVYVTPDGEYALVGSMLNPEGYDIGAEQVRRVIDEPRYGPAWEQFETANFFIEGDENAPNILYTFTDPFCPYCRQLHESLQPYIEAGRVQVRHLMVGIIREASPAIAATIIGSENPYETFIEHMRTYDDGGIMMDGTAMRRGQSLMRHNQEIMRSLNLSSTPATFFKDRHGVVHMVQGAPRDSATIEQMLAY